MRSYACVTAGGFSLNLHHSNTFGKYFSYCLLVENQRLGKKDKEMKLEASKRQHINQVLAVVSAQGTRENC